MLGLFLSVRIGGLLKNETPTHMGAIEFIKTGFNIK